MCLVVYYQQQQTMDRRRDGNGNILRSVRFLLRSPRSGLGRLKRPSTQLTSSLSAPLPQSHACSKFGTARLTADRRDRWAAPRPACFKLSQEAMNSTGAPALLMGASGAQRARKSPARARGGSKSKRHRRVRRLTPSGRKTPFLSSQATSAGWVGATK